MESQNSANRISSLRINEDIFNTVFSEIKNNEGAKIPQSVIIIGQEGSGKTTLLKRLYKSCPNRPRILIDGRDLFSTSDIVKSNNISNNSIIFIDNMDYYFKRCSYDEQYRLRRYLYNEGAPMMISTISKVLPAISEYEAPFFEGLKNVYIPPIPKEEISVVFGDRYLKRAGALLDLLSPTIKSLITVYNIIKLNKTPNRDQEILLSIFSDKYRTLYQNQPTYSQHILNALGTKTSGMKIPEIRDLIGLKTSILTAYLKSLKKNALIYIDSSIKKNTLYTIKDPLFRMWLNNSFMKNHE